MKKLIFVIVIIVFFLFGLSFFMQNPDSVTLYYYRGWQAQMPLAALLFITVVLGIIIGYFASLMKSLKLRTRLAKANRQIAALQQGQGLV